MKYVIIYYDKLIEEYNDSFFDPPMLKVYMESEAKEQTWI